LVRADANHEVDARGRALLIGFIDPESELGTALTQRTRGSISPIPIAQVKCWRSVLGSRLTQTRVEYWVRKELLNRRQSVKVHPRVRRVLKYLRENLAKGADVSLKTLATVSGLSPSRLVHVFTESVGVPLRPYILWLRLQRGSYELMHGATATQASHIAGFSDAAHLTRTFRRMLGTTPTNLIVRRETSQGVSIPST